MGAPTTLVDTNERALGTAGNPLVTTDAATPGGATPITGNQVTYTDRSGTVTTGATAQVLMAANAARRGATVQNNSTGNLTVNSLGTATTTAGIIIQPGQLYEFPATGVPLTAVSILGATTGQRFDAREW